MEGLEQLDMVGDISPALEATEDFIHCMDRMQGQGPSQAQTGNLQPPRQPKQLQEVSSAALGKLSSSGVWSLLAGEQPEVGPLGLAWADNFSVLGLGMGLRHGKRSRARSTNDLAAHSKECTNNTASSSSNSAFKKGHNRSRSDVNYRPSAYTDNGLPTVDCNTLKNMILNHQQEGDKSSSSSSVVKQGEMEQREGPRGRWTPCHVELTPCELRLYTLDSSANRQLGTAYSLSHCQSVISPAPCSQPGQAAQPADQRTLQALFFNCTRLQLRASSQWEAVEWRRLMWEKVQAARPTRQENRQHKTGVENQQVAKFPTPMSPSSSPSPSGLDTRPDGDSDTPTSVEASLSLQPVVLSRPTTLPLFTQRCQDVLKAGLLHQLMDQNNWRAFTFVLTRSALQAFPTEGRGSVSQPVHQFSLASCLSVQHDQEPENGEQWTDRGEAFQAVFPNEVLRLRADDQLKAQEWVEALREAVGAQKPAQEEGRESGEGPPGLQGVLLRSKPSRDRRQREAQRAKRQSVTTSFLSILTCLAVEKGLTAQSFRCAGCQRPVGLSRGKAKVCYYSGWYYCQSCHQDNSFLIPARLLHNWDTSKHKVSKQAKEFLEFVYEEPLLDIQQLNPCLYEHCEALSTVLRLRQQLQSLRAYLFSCRATIAEDLRRRIFPREYLLQHIHLYSMADLQQVIDGKLAPFLSKVIKFASSHVFSCSLCREKGFICELCHNGQVIYPFQENATRRCDGCGAVFHAECRQKAQPCPRCVRRELHHKRPSSFWSPDDDSPGCFHLPYQDT
ncbi:pleckstrin homology domain-containing family M member 3 [Acanthochromis polyacanthus]|uniref:Pleckstrin homology domain containing, family M, member 3 n=1 Tax=Acanthochromis polyacanthus TaxID=80966 RepID=A0A3Q1GJL3_9TELE|nr:pleckstrin homology domain-containing family M member 3 [Acanthochromis polyacanthus]XP_051814756.1 pleckstrin homology domain-containing family M member 3 [Acanthochromis polyacanthus]XP_051814757.1 pleckstrin homology domain-containing family M member 3 [Acanthochromis polyacanthus]XP_051814758.1 pleckstrin homology domain-containing family M member 3 [Acanthochromis polyacanthus]